MAKAAFWLTPDAESAKAWGANGIRYPGSPRYKHESWVLVGFPISAEANALSSPPGDYERKFKTQRN